MFFEKLCTIKSFLMVQKLLTVVACHILLYTRILNRKFCQFGVSMLAASNKKKHVLLAFGDEQYQELVRNLLSIEFEESISVVSSCDGIDATAKVQFQAFNCVLLDSKLEKKSYAAVAKFIRRSNLNENTPIIICADNVNEHIEQLVSEFSFIYIAHKDQHHDTLISMLSNQLKFNTKDKRVCAKFINSIFSTCVKYLNVSVNLDLKFDSVKVRNSQECLTDHTISIALENNITDARVFINFDDKSVNYLKKQFSFLESLNDDQVRKTFTNFILRKCLQELSGTIATKASIGRISNDEISRTYDTKGLELSLVSDVGFEAKLFIIAPRINKL